MSTSPPAAVCASVPADFSEALYLEHNPDVAHAVATGAFPSGRDHFARYGHAERRVPYNQPPQARRSSPLSPGSRWLVALRPTQDWLTWIALPVDTGFQPAYLRINYTLRHQETREICAQASHAQWLRNEDLELRFDPLPASANVTYELDLRIVVSSGPPALHFWHPAPTDPHAFPLCATLRYAPPLASGPSGVTFSPLTACRHACRHCLSRLHRDRPRMVSDAIVDDLREHFQSGRGEVWCVDYATDFFFAARQRPHLLDLVLETGGKLMVNTDGQHLTEPVIQRLLRSEILRIGFSCDAATETTYAKLRRGCGQLATVLNAARTVARHRTTARRPIIGLSMVVMRSNVGEISQLVERAAEVGADELWLNLLWVITPDMAEESIADEPELWDRALKAARAVGARLGVQVQTGPGLAPDLPQTGNTWCQEPWNSCVVLGNGDVLACASPRSRIGNLDGQRLEDIWNGPDYQRFRQRVNSANPPALCRHCPMLRKPGHPDGLNIARLPIDYDLVVDLRTTLPNGSQTVDK